MKQSRIPAPVAVAVIVAALAFAVWQFVLKSPPKEELGMTTKDLPADMKAPTSNDPNAPPQAVSGTPFQRPERPTRGGR
jgi:hypothetical protein